MLCWRLQSASVNIVMRMARSKLVGATAVYHCISRIVGGQMLLDDLGKEKLVGLLAWISTDQYLPNTRRQYPG